MKTYVFAENIDGTEEILFESKSLDSVKSDKECVEWVQQNCTEKKDYWEDKEGRPVFLSN